MKKQIFTFLSLALFLSIAHAAEGINVAVWDQDVQESYDESKNKEVFAVTDYILPLAHAAGGKWSEAASVLGPQNWTVTFDGKNLGTCKSKNYGTHPFDAFTNAQEPIGKVPHPDSPKKLSDKQLKSLRPLILVSEPNYQDPDGWKPSQLSSVEEKNLRAAFHKKFPKADNCVKFEKDEKQHPESYADTDVKSRKVYRSNKNTFIAEAHLEKWGCESISDNPFDSHWFGFTADGKFKYLSKRLTLIDAGDYDNSGKSKLVFEDDSQGGDDDNSRGYSIWNENFEMLAQRTRSLH